MPLPQFSKSWSRWCFLHGIQSSGCFRPWMFKLTSMLPREGVNARVGPCTHIMSMQQKIEKDAFQVNPCRSCHFSVFFSCLPSPKPSTNAVQNNHGIELQRLFFNQKNEPQRYLIPGTRPLYDADSTPSMASQSLNSVQTQHPEGDYCTGPERGPDEI